MRLFIAALLPDEVRVRMGEYIGALKSRCEGVKWEKRDKLHVTLKFLGGVEDSKASGISSLLRRLVLEYSAFDTAITGLGGFPGLGNPRILYVGLSENTELASLQNKIEEELNLLGFPREARTFVPHVTIGRVKSRLRIKEPLPAPEKYRFKIDEVGLIKSETRSYGSVYTPIDLFPLG